MATKLIAESLDLTDAYNFTGTLQQNGGSIGETNKPSFYATMTGQNCSSGSYTKLQFSTEVVDTNSSYDHSSNYRFTVPSGQAGLYFFTSQCQVPNIDDSERAQLVFYLNGSQKSETMSRDFAPSNQNTIYNNISSVFNLSVGDYVEVYVYHNEGSTQDSGYGQFGGFKISSV